MCYTLLSEMLPDSVAATYEFHADPQKRIWLANSNQSPRPEDKTVLFFSIKDEAYKQGFSDPHHYTSTNAEVLAQMRQIRLTVDCYSKVVPIGAANDVIRWLNTALISDQFYEWRLRGKWPAVIERIEIMPDLTVLLESNVWNQRAQMVVYLNYRDVVEIPSTPMTRVPTSLEDTTNSVDARTVLKS